MNTDLLYKIAYARKGIPGEFHQITPWSFTPIWRLVEMTRLLNKEIA